MVVNLKSNTIVLGIQREYFYSVRTAFNAYIDFNLGNMNNMFTYFYVPESDVNEVLASWKVIKRGLYPRLGDRDWWSITDKCIPLSAQLVYRLYNIVNHVFEDKPLDVLDEQSTHVINFSAGETCCIELNDVRAVQAVCHALEFYYKTFCARTQTHHIQYSAPDSNIPMVIKGWDSLRSAMYIGMKTGEHIDICDCRSYWVQTAYNFRTGIQQVMDFLAGRANEMLEYRLAPAGCPRAWIKHI